MKTKTQNSPTTKNQVSDFLTELYLRIQTGTKFSVTQLGKDYNLRDGRLLDFLQDVNVIKNIGGPGMHAIWKWNAQCKPSDQMAEQFLEIFEVYKYNMTVPAKKNPKVLHHFPAIDLEDNNGRPVITFTKTMEKRLSEIDFWTARSMVKHDQIEAHQRTIQGATIKVLDILNRNMISLRTGNITVETPILFGLIKLKSTIKIKIK